MSKIPRAPGFDNSLTLAKAGYRYISDTCERLQSPVFRTRLLLRDTICMRGDWASRVLYDNPHLVRHGAVPSPVLKTLMGETGVQTLDGEGHHDRKQMFLSLLSGENAMRVAEQVNAEWEGRLPGWERADKVVLHDAVAEILCSAVCKWAGVPIGESELPSRTADFEAMIGDGVSLRYFRARAARWRMEEWAASFVEAVRNHSLNLPDGSALRTIAL
jgi:fatty-acid peroxygenase